MFKSRKLKKKLMIYKNEHLRSKYKEVIISIKTIEITRVSQTSLIVFISTFNNYHNKYLKLY
jgi:hypothetical protein